MPRPTSWEPPAGRAYRSVFFARWSLYRPGSAIQEVCDVCSQRARGRRRRARCLAAGARAIDAGERPRLDYAEITRLARALGVEPGSLFVSAESPSEDDARDWRLGLDDLADRKMTAEASRSALESRSEPGARLGCGWMFGRAGLVSSPLR